MLRKNWLGSPRSYLCSEHFEEDCIIRGNKRAFLKEDAVPTIFKHKPRKDYKPRKKLSGDGTCQIHDHASCGQTEEVCQNFSKLQMAFLSTSEDVREGAEVVITLDGQSYIGVDEPLSASFKRARSNSPDVHKPPNADHGYALPMTKSGMRAKLLRMMHANEVLRKKLRTVSMRLHRSRKVAGTLKDVIEHLRKDHVVSEKACGAIQAAAKNIPAEIIELMNSNLQSGKKVKRPQKYSDSIKEFAITLQFYSSSAYDYVRSICGIALLIRSNITRWFSNVQCEAGFTSQAFSTLKALAEKSENTILVNLMMDEV